MAGYLSDQHFIAAHHLPAALIDLAQDQGEDLHRLLRHTGLFREQLIRGEARVSAREYLQLIHNTRQRLDDPELAFRYGQRLFPGHYGAVSSLLGNAGSLAQALSVFTDFPALISPLLASRLTLTDEYLCLQWLDSCGAGSQWRFLVEAAMTGVASVTRWLSGSPLPWRFQFSYPCPPWPEQYQVHLGEPLHFAAQMDAMILPRHYLDQPWPQRAPTAWLAARQECERQLSNSGAPYSFRHSLYRFLQSRPADPPSLQESADHMACSAATLKRRLAQQGCHYQQLLDEVRLHQAILWLQFHGYSTEQVSRQLNFSDTTNFRRSFKRWCGLTPAACQRILAIAMGAPNGG
ncbi:MAG: AraC family transcriptional regulator [Pseudomonadales bacterium]|nr:AraC family transcriptional regulator [Pseudomonadales bacterium]